MNKYLIFAAILGVLALPVTVTPAYAEDTVAEEGSDGGGFFKKRYDRYKKWRNASDEEKDAYKEKKKDRIERRHDKWESLSDEEKAELKDKRKDRRAHRRDKAKDKYNSLNEDQQAKARKFRNKTKDKRQNYRQKRRDYWNNLND